MGRKRAEPPAVALTSSRAARLFRLLSLLGTGAQPRPILLRKLKLDVRGFYRDLEALRGFGIEIGPDSQSRYGLAGNLDDSLARLPFPDPGLSVRDALQLAAGSSPAHRRLRRRVNAFLGNSRTV
jgi:hypothetical protein